MAVRVDNFHTIFPLLVRPLLYIYDTYHAVNQTHDEHKSGAMGALAFIAGQVQIARGEIAFRRRSHD
jgi:hypothetical protein